MYLFIITITFAPIKPILKMKKLFVLFAAATLLVGVQACKQQAAAGAADKAKDAAAAGVDKAAAAAKDAIKK